MDSGPGSIALELLLILFLILINAFFAASEIAVLSANKVKLGHLADEGNKKAALLLKLTEEPSRFLATIQVGITLAGFLASASAAVSISEAFAFLLKKIPIAFISNASHQIAVIVVTIFLSFITLIFGELLPKRLALKHSEKMALFAAKPIKSVAVVMKPFVKILTTTTNFFVRLFDAEAEITDEKVTEEEIRMMIDVGEENGVLNETEKEMIDGIFEFDNTLAREVMTPRTDVFMIEVSTPMEKIITEVLEEGYSRIPVYEEDTDNITGVLYIKDLFAKLYKANWNDISLKELLRAPYFVPETKNTDILFRELQKSKNHMALLIDEYGGFSGIVTMEDLVEEVMGNIFDEYDEDYEKDEYIQKIDDDTYVVNGLVGIDEINDKLHTKIPDENCDTIGGFVIDLIGNIPEEDSEHVVEYENLVFKIEKVNEKRIEFLKIYVQQG